MYEGILMFLRTRGPPTRGAPALLHLTRASAWCTWRARLSFLPKIPQVLSRLSSLSAVRVSVDPFPSFFLFSRLITAARIEISRDAIKLPLFFLTINERGSSVFRKKFRNGDQNRDDYE